MTRPATLLISALLLTGCAGSAPPVEDLPTGTLVITVAENSVAATEYELKVSIADTPEAKEQGLMGVEEMDEDVGMVFLEPEPVQQSFWMKDTLIPLSVAFWDQSRHIVAVIDMDPCLEEPCTLYDPGVAWVGAVEVNQGYFDRHAFELGTTSVRLER
jgi:uncharacterized membrane protein (UPF0127 family)